MLIAYSLQFFFSDYKKTDLKSYVEVFERFLNKLEKTWKGKNIEQSGTLFINSHFNLFNRNNLVILDLKGLEGDF